MSDDEVYFGEVPAVRKGRNQSPCELRIGVVADGQVVLRTVDKSGVSPIVVVLEGDQATDAAIALLRSVRATQTKSPGKIPEKRKGIDSLTGSPLPEASGGSN